MGYDSNDVSSNSKGSIQNEEVPWDKDNPPETPELLRQLEEQKKGKDKTRLEQAANKEQDKGTGDEAARKKKKGQASQEQNVSEQPNHIRNESSNDDDEALT